MSKKESVQKLKKAKKSVKKPVSRWRRIVRWVIVVALMVVFGLGVWKVTHLEPLAVEQIETSREIGEVAVESQSVVVGDRKTVGLALGSGGARGLAHIGVLKAFEENGIAVDYISGSSMGAVVGGIYASTRDVAYLEQVSKSTTWENSLALVDLSVQSGIVQGEKLTAYVEDLVRGRTFENVQVPLAVVATDLATGESVTFRDGELAPAIRASASIPFVFRPFEYRERVLVDGGLSAPVPVHAVQEMGADVVIAVDLDAMILEVVDGDNAVDQGLYASTRRSFDIMRHHLAHVETDDADVIIAPHANGVEWYEFAGNAALIDVGYAAAMAQMEEIQRLLAE